MKQSIGGPSDRQRLANLAGITMTEDENFLTLARIHGAIYWKGVAVIIFGMLLLLTVAMNAGFFLIFVGVIMLVLAHLTRQFLILAASDKRIFIRSGILYADMAIKCATGRSKYLSASIVEETLDIIINTYEKILRGT